MKGVFLIAVLLAVLSQCVFSDDTLDYGIMIDAGSSGSRIYLYQWPHRDDPSLPLVEPTMIDQTVISMKINTPLASFATNVSYAGNSLDPLIAYIKKNLDSSRYSDTPIYLKATAGMRAISEADQNAIIANVRVYLANTPFDFKPEYAQVIPGSAEGVYGWITVNYLLEILQVANPSTSGALDMGGASTQITFVPTTGPTQYNFSSVFSSRLYNLYSYSYPLGQDQSNRLILAGLFTDKVMNLNGNVMNPCYLQGYSEQDTINGVTVIGTSNYSACAAAVLKYIVKPDAGCVECGMDSVYQPPVVGSFYAFSGFAYTFQFFGLSSTATIAQLRAKAQEFCSYNYTQAQAAYPKGDSFLKSYCFTSSYFVQALTQYGFAETTNSITFTSSVGSTEVTWALGGMIYEANLLPIDNIPTTTTTGNSTTSTSSTTSGSSTSSASSSVSFCFVSSFVLFLVLFSLVL